MEEKVLLFSEMRFCPECHSEDVRRSRRWGMLEKFVYPLFLMRPYRCQACNSRYIGLAYAGRIKKNGPAGSYLGNARLVKKGPQNINIRSVLQNSEIERPRKVG